MLVLSGVLQRHAKLSKIAFNPAVLRIGHDMQDFGHIEVSSSNTVLTPASIQIFERITQFIGIGVAEFLVNEDGVERRWLTVKHAGNIRARLNNCAF